MSEVKWGTKSLQEGYRFEATIKSMEWKDNQFDRKQLNITLIPKEGKERTIFLPYSERLDSKWGIFQKGLETSGIPVDLDNLDPEKWLIGKTFLFEDRPIHVMGKDTKVTVPIKYLGEGSVETKQTKIPEQPEKPLKDRMLETLAEGDKEIDELNNILKVDMSEILDTLQQLVSEGKVKTLKGGIVHLIQ